jgi:hypothetical protein
VRSTEEIISDVQAALQFLQEHPGAEGRVALLLGVSVEKVRELGGVREQEDTPGGHSLERNACAEA